MIVLGIDSATPHAGVGIVKDGRLLARRVTSPDKNHSETLLGAIVDAMKEADVGFSDIDLMAVGLGPGSFTALRIGVSTMKALSYAHDVPLVGISTLDILAGGVLTRAGDLVPGDDPDAPWRRMVEQNAKVAAVIDARREELYCAVYTPGEEDVMVRETPYRTITPGALLDGLEGPTILVGSGCSLFDEGEAAGHVIVSGEYRHPDGGVCADMAREGYKAGRLSDDRDLVPLYVRRSDAEINYERRMRKDLQQGH
jgi:tRNA threonylcarbamoyladenosine biosynthesis protein TsaB